MRRTLIRWALPWCLPLLSLGCEGDIEARVQVLSSTTPLTLEDGLFYGESAEGGRALVLDLTGEPRAIEHVLPAGGARQYERPGSGGREVVVLTSGREAYKDDDGRHPLVPSHVLVFSRERELVRVPLLGRYGQLALSDDGRFALAFQSTGNLTLQNAVEVVDLQKASAGEASPSTLVDLSLDGRAPTRFVFSPAGFARRLALAPLPNALQVIDLEHPERREISITLSESGALDPQEILFAGDRIFVQSGRDARILSFQLIDVPRGQHPFQLAPSVLTASGPVTDIAVTGAGDALRLLALTGRLDVLDPVVGNDTRLEGATGFASLHQFDGSSPVDSQIAPRAALYARGRSQVGFVDLGVDSTWAARNVELVELVEPLVSFVPVPARNLAVVTHTGARISVVDLAERTVRVVLLDAPARTLLVDATADAARLWVQTNAPTLGRIDLVTFAAIPIPLSFDAAQSGLSLPSDQAASAEQLRLVPSTQRRRIALPQRASSGRVTLLDAEDPKPETALELVGFFLAGLFD